MDKLNQQDQILLDAYLIGKLSANQKSQFEHRLEDPVFAQALTDTESVLSSIQSGGRDQLNDLLVQSDEKLDKVGTTSFPIKTIGLVLSMLLALFLLWQYMNQSADDSEEIYVTHYEKFQNMVAPTVRTKSNLNTIEQALFHYENGQYGHAVSIFDTISNLAGPVVIYQALSNLELDHLDAAEQQLKVIAGNQTAKYKEAAEMYLCLLYLKQDKLDLSLNQIAHIKRIKGHKYLSKALALEQAINDIH